MANVAEKLWMAQNLLDVITIECKELRKKVERLQQEMHNHDYERNKAETECDRLRKALGEIADGRPGYYTGENEMRDIAQKALKEKGWAKSS